MVSLKSTHRAPKQGGSPKIGDTLFLQQTFETNLKKACSNKSQHAHSNVTMTITTTLRDSFHFPSKSEGHELK